MTEEELMCWGEYSSEGKEQTLCPREPCSQPQQGLGQEGAGVKPFLQHKVSPC